MSNDEYGVHNFLMVLFVPDLLTVMCFSRLSIESIFREIQASPDDVRLVSQE